MEKSLNPLNSTPIAILIGAVIIGLAILTSGGIIKFGKTSQTSPAPAANLPSQPQVIQDLDKLRTEDHVRGERSARVLLIEYSDLECPFCKRMHPDAKKLVDSYKGELAWVYRHFPLDQLHSKADKEAEAAECAAELGGDEAFWKLTDKIFEVTPSNNGLDLDTLPTLASEVGLDQAKLKSCLDSGKQAARVEADYQSGVKAGVQGTPGNFLLDNKTGKIVPVPGAQPYDSFKTQIDTLLGS